MHGDDLSPDDKFCIYYFQLHFKAEDENKLIKSFTQ